MPISEDNNHIEEINEIINSPPNWLVRWGMLLCFSILLLIVSVSAFIHYPDIIKSKFQVQSINDDNNNFRGIMNIAKDNIHRVHHGQKVLIKLKNYPSEEPRIIEGEISFVSNISTRDSTYTSQVTFDKASYWEARNNLKLNEEINLEADIVADEGTLLDKIIRSIMKDKISY